MKPVPHGEPYAGKLHVRFDEGAGVPDNKGRPALLYTTPSRTPRGKSISLRQSVSHASTKPCFNQFASLPFIVWLLM